MRLKQTARKSTTGSVPIREGRPIRAYYDQSTGEIRYMPAQFARKSTGPRLSPPRSAFRPMGTSHTQNNSKMVSKDPREDVPPTRSTRSSGFPSTSRAAASFSSSQPVDQVSSTSDNSSQTSPRARRTHMRPPKEEK